MAWRKRFLAVSALGLAVLVATGCVNRPPQLDCGAGRASVVEGSSVQLTVQASDPDRFTFGGDSDKLTLSWSASQGRVSGGGLDQDANTPVSVSATFDATGLKPGTYQVTAELDDRKLQETCSIDVMVEKNKQKPTIACNPSSVNVTEGKSVTLKASASDANNDPLTYSWKVDGSSVSGNMASFQFGTTGRSIGSHRATVTATDSDNMTASCTFNVSINRRPNTDPKVTLSLSKSEVMMGEAVMATAKASDAEGDPITYAWAVNGRSMSGSGSTYSVNTSGMGGGSHAVSVTASDDRGGKGMATASFKVRENIVIQVNGRLNNVAKAKLDEIALKLQQNPSLMATITGHTDSVGSEKGNMRGGAKRADRAKAYLTTQHSVGDSRIATKSAGESMPIADNKTREGRKENRRVEVELYVP